MSGGGEVLKFSLSSKNVLSPDETELYELTQLAGIVTDPSVFKIILDLLKLNVAPAAILHMLKCMSAPAKRKPAPPQGKNPPTRTKDLPRIPNQNRPSSRTKDLRK